MKTSFAGLLLLVTACASLRQPTSHVDSTTEPGSGIAHVVVEVDNARLPGVEVAFEGSSTKRIEITSVTGEVTAPLGGGVWKMSAALPGFVNARKMFVVSPNLDVYIHVELAAARIENITIYEPPPTIRDPGVLSLSQREIQLLPFQ